MVAYKNKMFTQRGESLKPWIKKDQNAKQGGVWFNNTYCKICKHTKDCRAKSNFKNYQPWRHVQVHLVQEEMDGNKTVGDGYQNGVKYGDVLQAFIAESLSTMIPNSSNVHGIWYLYTGATN